MSQRLILPCLIATIVSILSGCAAAPPIPAPPNTPPASAKVGETTILAIAAPAAPSSKQTLPEFLGITGLFKAVGGGVGRIRSRLGMLFPGLEPKPAVLPITDPANSGPDQPPAVQGAAAVKAEEEAAPQKVKAIRYLAGVGCGGCYPDVEDSFLAALDDCTEAVRYEAVKALRSAAGNPCQFCRCDTCCSPKVRTKLHSVAYDTKKDGCFKEGSDRVRRVARLAMNACGGPTPAQNSDVPKEGPAAEADADEEPPPEGPADVATVKPPVTLNAATSILTSDPNSGSQAVTAPPSDIAVHVNGEPILWSEILAVVAAERAGSTAQGETSVSPPSEDRIRQVLHRAIDNRLLSQESRRRLPQDEVYRATSLAVQKRNPDGLSGKEQVVVTALARDEILAGEWVNRATSNLPEFSREEMYNYYRANLERYREADHVRWEQLSARFSRFASHAQAERAMSYLRASTLGQNPAGSPQGLNLGAIESVSHQRTADVDLPDGAIGVALATLPVGQTSPILKDAVGLHLIRVLERDESRIRLLNEVIDVVRKDMLQQRQSRILEKHVQKLRREADIRTTPVAQVAFEAPVGHAAASVLYRLPAIDNGLSRNQPALEKGQRVPRTIRGPRSTVPFAVESPLPHGGR